MLDLFSPFQTFAFQHFSSAATCLSAFQAPIDPSTALGGFSGNNYSEVYTLSIYHGLISTLGTL